MSSLPTPKKISILSVSSVRLQKEFVSVDKRKERIICIGLKSNTFSVVASIDFACSVLRETRGSYFLH